MNGFIELITLGGKGIIKEAVVNTKDGVSSAYVISEQTDVAIHAVMKGSPLPEGTIGMQNLELLSNVPFKATDCNEVEYKIKDNRLMIEHKDIKIKMILKNPKYVKTYLSPEVFNGIKSKIVPGTLVHIPARCIQDIRSLMNLGRKEKCNITFQNDKAYVVVGDEHTDLIEKKFTLENTQVDGSIHLTLGLNFFNAINNQCCTPVVDMVIKNESNILIQSDCDYINYEAVVTQENG